MNKKYLKLIAIDIAIAIIVVILYSPGLIALRVTDESIFRAGMSILAGMGLTCVFFYVNIRMLRDPKPIHIAPDEVYDLDEARKILRSYMESRMFGSIAKTASGQLDRVQKCRNRINEIIGRKFTEGSMSWDKFQSIVANAEESAIKNVVAMSGRMSIFDEKEYERLKTYKEDDIPDDIQEQQLKLYRDNYESTKAALALNEKILLKLDALAVGLSSFEINANEDRNNEILEEIEKLTNDAKYYQ